jgi:hypothetical protein
VPARMRNYSFGIGRVVGYFNDGAR